MKLIYFSNSDLFSKKANSIQVMKMCEAFSNDFEEVVLYAYSHQKSIESVHEFYGVRNNFIIKIYPLKRNRLNRILNSILTLVPLLFSSKNEKITVYCREIFSSFFSSLLHIKNIYEIHNLPSVKTVPLIKYIFNAKANLFNISISNNLKNKLIELYKPTNTVYVCHDGASLSDNIPKALPEFYDQYSFNIGYVGHLYKGRGIELIIELAKRLPEFGFQIVGGEKEDLKRLSNNSPNNIFYHGFVTPKETIRYRYFSDILLMPYMDGLGDKGSLIDTSPWMSPMKLFEYMSSKKPIISTDLPVLREILNENNAILVPYEVLEWEKAIMKIYNNKEFAHSIANQSFNDLSTKYTWAKRSESISKLIKQLF